MKNKPLIFWCFGLVGFVLCVLVAQLEYAYYFGPNTRRYINGPVRADGDIDFFGHSSYNWLRIGKSESPYKGQFAFDIQMADGTIFSFPNADLSAITAKANTTRKPDNNLWSKDAIEYMLWDCGILVADGQVGSVRFLTNSQTAIRTDSLMPWHHLPLSDKDLTTLFGPAQRIIETRHR